MSSYPASVTKNTSRATGSAQVTESNLHRSRSPKTSHSGAPPTASSKLDDDGNRSDESEESLNSGDEDGGDENGSHKTPTEIEEALFRAVVESNRAAVRDILEANKPSQVLQILLTFAYSNRPPADLLASKANLASIRDIRAAASAQPTETLTKHGGHGRLASWSSLKQHLVSFSSMTTMHGISRPYFQFDSDILQEAHELLGTSVSPLNFIQIACMNGEEELAMDILDFVYQHTESRHKKLLKMEFLGKVWGDGNTTLHLASFQGMGDLVQKLLEYGSNTNKKNGRGYRPVDCANDDTTCNLFRNITEDKPRKPSLESHHSKKNSVNGTQDRIASKTQRPSDPDPGPSGRSIRDDSVVSSRSPTVSSPLSIRRDQTKPNKRPKLNILFEANTLLLDYSKNGELDKIKELLSASRENRLPQSKSKQTSSGSSKVLYSPLSNTLDINYHSPHTGLTPLHMACGYGHLEVIKYFIEVLKADLTARDEEGWTVLHSTIAEIPPAPTASQGAGNPNYAKEKAAREHFLNVLNYMLNLPNIDIRAMTNDGETILDVVREDEDSGDIDVEVMEIIENFLRNHNIELERSTREAETDDDLESSSVSEMTSPLPVKNVVVQVGTFKPTAPGNSKPVQQLVKPQENVPAATLVKNESKSAGSASTRTAIMVGPSSQQPTARPAVPTARDSDTIRKASSAATSSPATPPVKTELSPPVQSASSGATSTPATRNTPVSKAEPSPPAQAPSSEVTMMKSASKSLANAMPNQPGRPTTNDVSSQKMPSKTSLTVISNSGPAKSETASDKDTKSTGSSMTTRPFATEMQSKPMNGPGTAPGPTPLKAMAGLQQRMPAFSQPPPTTTNSLPRSGQGLNRSPSSTKPPGPSTSMESILAEVNQVKMSAGLQRTPSFTQPPPAANTRQNEAAEHTQNTSTRLTRGGSGYFTKKTLISPSSENTPIFTTPPKLGSNHTLSNQTPAPGTSTIGRPTIVRRS